METELSVTQVTLSQGTGATCYVPYLALNVGKYLTYQP